MKSYEFTRFYHPKLGRFVYKHKRSGVIVDNIFKPLKAITGAVFKKFAKPVAKKALGPYSRKHPESKEPPKI